MELGTGSNSSLSTLSDALNRSTSPLASHTQELRDGFASVLSRSRRDVSKTPEQAARESAEQLVAIALIQPVLKQLRETNNAAPPFAPSAAEKQFQSLFDSQVARRIAGAKRFGVVDRIAGDLMKRVNGGSGADASEGKSIRGTGGVAPASEDRSGYRGLTPPAKAVSPLRG
jgi:Rod binding domain-containing protein